ncbi:hypothetical protein J5N97_017093 [Dioscorea zingiberensis]|uniref:Uncharacterized protein n=1 Tax=Dioscorea zingiberensis TaxID=325984 RepID=A0A9D5CML7_9LILI|nr:hypothetical protein J5N97_017093 [Dioscorea zingiberensis]
MIRAGLRYNLLDGIGWERKGVVGRSPQNKRHRSLFSKPSSALLVVFPRRRDLIRFRIREVSYTSLGRGAKIQSA